MKVIFFFADTGYPDFNRADANGNKIPPSCRSGADCVYQRYLAIGRGPAFEAAGITDVDSFTQLYWREQFASGGALIVLSVGGALGGGLMYRPGEPSQARGTTRGSSGTYGRLRVAPLPPESKRPGR